MTRPNKDGEATPRPWRWVDRYDFNDHAAHQAQGLAADCENIRDGRIMLVDANGKTVLDQWADYAGDAGLEVSLADAALIVEAVNSHDLLKRENTRLVGESEGYKGNWLNAERDAARYREALERVCDYCTCDVAEEGHSSCCIQVIAKSALEVKP